MTTTQYDSMIAKAHDVLSQAAPRARYAHDVLSGIQLWSGADLQGKAKHYGARYQAQRALARRALSAAGGVVIATEQGRLRTARPVGQDDFGAELYETAVGIYRSREGAYRCERVA